MNKPLLKLSPEAAQAITTYLWPGNVRELENAIQRAVILTEDNSEISHDNLDIDLTRDSINEGNVTLISRDAVTGTKEAPDDSSLEDYFQRFVLDNQATMSETELARKLGVSRKCLWERRQRLGIPRKKHS
jgi:DNA-binding NtrC family response regulator